MRNPTIKPMLVEGLSNRNLLAAAVEAAAQGLNVEAYAVRIDADTQLDLLWVPGLRRAGVVQVTQSRALYGTWITPHDKHPQWTDTADPADAVCRWREGRMEE